MVQRERLEKLTVTQLRALVKRYEADAMIKGYKTMKKSDLIDAMLKKKVVEILKDAKELRDAEKKPPMKKEEEKPQAIGPRNLTKGFGIRRTIKKVADRKDYEKFKELAGRGATGETMVLLTGDLLLPTSKISPEQRKEVRAYVKDKLKGTSTERAAVGKDDKADKQTEKIESMSGEDIEKLKEIKPLVKILQQGERSGDKSQKVKTQNKIKKIMKGYKGSEFSGLPGTFTFKNKVFENAFINRPIERSLDAILKIWNEKNVR